MERLEYDRYGGPEVMQLRSFTLPPHRADEVVVRVAAASLNPMDWKIRNGDMKLLTGFKFPRALGTDFSGTVEEVGSQVSNVTPGDAVLGTVSMKASGAFAPRLVTASSLIVKKPERLSFSEAASLPIAGATAWHALVTIGKLRAGQKLFVNGATGAVGQAATAIARDIGAMVVGRVSPRSVASSSSLGLSSALDYTKPIPPALDGSFDVVFDVNGSLTIREGDRLVKRGGKVLDIVPTKAKFLIALVSKTRNVVFADVKAPTLQHVADLAATGGLRIPVVKTIALVEATALLASLELGARLDGKAVIAF